MVEELKPIAIPRMKRPAMSSVVELAKPIVSEPIVKTMLEIKMINLRPILGKSALLISVLLSNFLQVTTSYQANY